MRKKLKQISCKNVTKPAYLLMKYALMFSCLLLSASLLVAVYTGGFSARSCRQYFLYAELFRTPQSILLVASIGALYIDQAFKK